MRGVLNFRVSFPFLPAEGEVELTVQGRTWRPALGEEVFIPAGVAHTVRNVGGTTRRWWYGYRTRPSPDRESPP